MEAQPVDPPNPPSPEDDTDDLSSEVAETTAPAHFVGRGFDPEIERMYGDD
ncbi:hypothetical protein BH20ACT17_BH20ACT17_03190 [soil metagenome]|jgi:hypothetical protein